jgi:2-dehydro-3-deoxy-D-gluconate 5-dehydrogenase
VLEGKVAVITGASRGIGLAVSERLVSMGADIGVLQRGGADAARQAAEAAGRRFHAVSVDLEDAEAAQRGVDEIAETLGRVDVLVANAGVIERGPALELTLDSWRRQIAVDLTTVFATSQAMARRLVAQESGGAIVMLASVLAFQGGINVCAYAAAKAGVANLARALANEWAPLGIRVNAVAPGYVANELTEPLRQDPQRRDAISARIPAGRWATDDDIASAVAWLAGPDAGYVHGHVLAVDGGWLAR